MFFLKKVVSRCFFPLPLSLELLLLGLFLLWFTRRQRLGKGLVTCGVLALLGLGNVFTANALLHPLEHRYPPFSPAEIKPGDPPINFIAVLGGFGDHDPDVPITSHLGPDQMVRLVEGVRVHREIPGSKLILSGSFDSAEGMTQMAETLGISADEILQLSNPRDTEDEGRQLASIVGSQRFILVTSAVHMPRAMMLLRERGLQPIAAPTDYLSPRHHLESDDFIPDAYKLFKTQVAFYEYLGLAWETWRAK